MRKICTVVVVDINLLDKVRASASTQAPAGTGRLQYAELREICEVPQRHFALNLIRQMKQ